MRIIDVHEKHLRIGINNRPPPLKKLLPPSAHPQGFDLVKAAPSTYVLFDERWPHWRKLDAIHFARLVWLDWRSESQVIFRKESAAYLHDFWLPRQAPAICVLCHTNTVISFRSYTSRKGDFTTPPIRATKATNGPKNNLFETTRKHGLNATDPDTTVIECLRFCDRKTGFLVACSALAKQSHAHLFDIQGTAQRAVRLIHHWERLLEASKGRRGRKRAAELLNQITPWCQSPFEALLLFNCYEHKLPIPRQQVEIRGVGQRFFLDFVFETPGQKLAVEVDGLMKTGENLDDFRRYQRRDIERDRILEARGFKVRHFTSNEVLDTDYLVKTLREDLATLA